MTLTAEQRQGLAAVRVSITQTGGRPITTGLRLNEAEVAEFEAWAGERPGATPSAWLEAKREAAFEALVAEFERKHRGDRDLLAAVALSRGCRDRAARVAVLVAHVDGDLPALRKAAAPNMAGWLAGFNLLRPYRAAWLPDPDDHLDREIRDAGGIVEDARRGALAPSAARDAKLAAGEVARLEERAANLAGQIKAAKARARTAAAEAKREARTVAKLRKAVDRAEARSRRDAELRAARELVDRADREAAAVRQARELVAAEATP